MGMIVKLAEDKYVDWSTVCDAPGSSVMTKQEMVDFVKDQQLRQMHLRPGELEAIEDERLRQLKQEIFDLEVNRRLERIEKNGSSSMHGDSADDVIAGNRAGKGETRLTKQEIIETYTYDDSKKGQWPWR